MHQIWVVQCTQRSPFILFVNFCIISYGDTVEQATCMFSRLISAIDFSKSRTVIMVRIKRESMHIVCSTVSLERMIQELTNRPNQ